MRKRLAPAVWAALSALLIALGSCGNSSGETIPAGPTIEVASFDFAESVILAEIYAQALEGSGYSVEKNLNLGSRELLFPEIEAGNVDLIPEYVGSSLQVGFGADAPTSTAEGIAALAAEFETFGMVVLDPAPGEDKNVFVVTFAFAGTYGVTTVADLADVGDITLGGPPECEARVTCYAGLVDAYGLSNLSFESIADGPARTAALMGGEIDVSLFFSTDPTIRDNGFVALDDPEGLVAPENIVPVVSSTVVDAYGDDLVNLINGISSEITTDALLELNGRANRGQDPDDIAEAWLTEHGYLNG